MSKLALPDFIPGLQLSEFLYEEAVRPILDRRFPGLAYSAALIGNGSEVLGFDTPQSMDHDWGPRLRLFLAENEFEQHRECINQVLCRELPTDIRGFPIDLAWVRSSDEYHGPATGDPSHHGISFHTLQGYFQGRFNIDPASELRAADWLVISQQYLRCLTAGQVFHDGLGQLEPLRLKLHYYPPDIWLYLLAAQWQRISQEEPFMGRCGQAQDELGSRLVAMRLVRDLMRLGFLLERQYAPYIKWLGTAFQRLDCARVLTPLFERIMRASTWQKREKPLVAALEYAAELQNRLGLAESLPARASPFYDRPFQVIHAGRFAEALNRAIQDVEVKRLPPNLGSVDQFIDSTDVLDNPERLKKLGNLFTEES